MKPKTLDYIKGKWKQKVIEMIDQSFEGNELCVLDKQWFEVFISDLKENIRKLQ